MYTTGLKRNGLMMSCGKAEARLYAAQPIVGIGWCESLEAVRAECVEDRRRISGGEVCCMMLINVNGTSSCSTFVSVRAICAAKISL
jgi:hypothetical protein